MFAKLQSFAPRILGVTRLLVGVMLACRGALIAAGLFTRGASFLMSGLMAFAYFLAHAPGSSPSRANGRPITAVTGGC
jgi:uncharacterized membrane protein YphA (DoxX/SURF4 family)